MKFKKVLRIFSVILLIGIISVTYWLKTNDNIKIFKANNNLTKLEAVNSKENDNTLESIIRETIKMNSNCINQNTKLFDVKVKNRIAYVNFSNEFDDPNTNSSSAAEMKINSIVNGLCLNKSLNIDGVKFLINGEKILTIGPISTENIIKPLDK